MRSRFLLCGAVLAFAFQLFGCEAPEPSNEEGATVVEGIDDEKDDGTVGARIAWGRVSTRKAIPGALPPAGRFRIHMIDVGTGLSVLIQGHDFTALYDGGSGDDRAGITTVGATTKNGNRLLAYLFASLGPSGEKECTPDGDGWPKIDRPELTIDHLFLSHPHEDHDSLLDDVLRCYDVKEVWDSGDDNDREGYSKFLTGVAGRPDVIYHDGAGRHPGDVVSVFGKQITLPQATEDMADGQRVALGAKASFTLLHVDGEQTQDENLNSTVVRFKLGLTTLLLAGDAESGARLPPTSAVGHIEADLLRNHASELKSDILQVAHHGSSTSNRLEFLKAVSPKVALLGAGPLPYSGVVLPERSVVDAITTLPGAPLLLRTDASDATVEACTANGVKVDRIGNDDGHPGGCDNYILQVR